MLHQVMKKIVEMRKDVAFYVKMFPPKTHSEAYEKSKSIVCEKSLTLLRDAFKKKTLPKPSCETLAVDENMKLAQDLGITSVPMIILPDGRLLPGYKDTKTLINLIGN
jgi:thiol:disulfide interchange protein DsbC